MSTKWKKRAMKIRGFFNQIFSLILLRYTRLSTLRLKKQIKHLGVSKLHIGCGEILIKGWLNITLEKREQYGAIEEKDGALCLNYNLLKEWPLEEESMDFVAASHFIEHFDLNGGLRFAQKAYRVLKREGVIRLSCPDLEIYAKNYTQNNKEFFNNDLVREWCCFDKATTPGEIFAAKAYDSGGEHKWFYDFDSLKHVLESAGFKQVEKKSRLEGKTPDLDTIEHPEREIETVYIEGIKKT